MSTEHILAMRSEYGEIYLYDETDSFFASFKNGKWVADLIFSADDLIDNFIHLGDDNEIERLLAEARTVLGKPLQE